MALRWKSYMAKKKTKINKHSNLILSQNVVSECDLISELTELNKELALIELSDGETCMITTWLFDYKAAMHLYTPEQEYSSWGIHNTFLFSLGQRNKLAATSHEWKETIAFTCVSLWNLNSIEFDILKFDSQNSDVEFYCATFIFMLD